METTTTTTTTTIAERLTERCGGDGQRWRTPDGQDCEAIWYCESLTVLRRDGATRYVFSDGSAIVACEGGWDIGYSADELDGDADDPCYCWREEPHYYLCPHSDEARAEAEAEAEREVEAEAEERRAAGRPGGTRRTGSSRRLGAC